MGKDAEKKAIEDYFFVKFPLIFEKIICGNLAQSRRAAKKIH